MTKRELAILKVLMFAAPEAMYGMDIAKQVYPRWLFWLMPAGIYVHLMRLEDLRLIVHQREQVLDGTGRLPRYTYRITDRGRRVSEKSTPRAPEAPRLHDRQPGRIPACP
jgi:DNA-binding PadR family transcriptional regulator